MLYLAEAQKKTGFIGGGKVEFKLLACQRGEQSWSAVPGEEVIPAPDDATYNAGALVMVDLSNNRQIQRHSEAGRQLVSILQNFSNLNKKSKTQEEEIEQWKQSLTFQSQALNEREMELEARQEQIEQAEADAEQVESQREEVETSRAEVEQLRGELERKTQELEGAWAHLNGEMRKLEERQADLAEQSGLGEAEMQQLQAALGRLTGAIAPTESVREQLNATSGDIDAQQGRIDESWQALEQARNQVSEEEAQVNQKAGEVSDRWHAWHEEDGRLTSLKVDLKLQQGLLEQKQRQIKSVSEALQDQSNLHQQVYKLLNTSDKVRLGNKVDVAALEAMELDGLQSTVADLEKDLEKVSRFVNDQEEELTLQQEAIDELKTNMGGASEYDKLQLETELADEQDRYQMLNETLVGQRRNLLERQEILSQHQAVLMRRQGLSTEDSAVGPVDLEPVLAEVDKLRQQTSDTLQRLEDDAKALHDRIDGLKSDVQQKAESQTSQKEEIKQMEAELLDLRNQLGKTQGQIELYEALLQPSQDGLAGVKQKLDGLAGELAKFQEASDYQLQAIADMRQTIASVSGDAAEVGAS
ncbi:MAG: pilus motility taxis protein HmpF [Cyanobacteria bacterium P01_H01_bin.119]